MRIYNLIYNLVITELTELLFGKLDANSLFSKDYNYILSPLKRIIFSYVYKTFNIQNNQENQVKLWVTTRIKLQ